MKKKSLVMVVAALLATGCQNTTSQAQTSVVSSSSEVASVSEPSSAIPSISSELSSSTSINASSSNPYFKWDEEVVKVLVEAIIPDTSEEIPSFDFATYIEYEYKNILIDEVFGIFCKTTDPNSEEIYKSKLIANDWIIADEKADCFYEARSKDGEILIQFEYNDNMKDEGSELTIYVMPNPLLEFPSNKISKKLQKLLPGTKTIIPAFESQLYKVNDYIVEYGTLCINGYGFDENVVETYKTALINNNWVIMKSYEEGKWDGVSPDNDIKIQFYINESMGDFNVDVQKKEKSSSTWLTQEISELVSSIGSTGKILEYQGGYKGVRIMDAKPHPVIIIETTSKDIPACVDEYNQMLIDNGYVLAGTYYNQIPEDYLYCYPGTTLAYHAYDTFTGVMTIELYDLSEISPIE